MTAQLSPRDFAEALGVSESSLKRWIDAGRIRASRTEGGHRRVALADALAFVRATRAHVARPELLGLPAAPAAAAISPHATPGDGPPDAILVAALIDGDARAVTAHVHAYHRAGASLAALCDGPLRRAMHTVGELWKHDPDGVVVEHRATDACLQAIASLRAEIDTAPDGPLALGGGPEDDPYLIPSAMAALVLAGEGFRPINLGADTPTQAFHRGVARIQPSLVWLSASAPLLPAHAHELAAFVTGLPTGVTTVVGGRNADALAAADSRVRLVDSMAELVRLARDLPR